MILWLNPVSGISGDMLLGALLSLGAPLDDVRTAIASTGITGWSLEAEPCQVGGIAATRAVVRVDDDVPGRHADELLDLARGAVPAAAAEMAARAITALARTEGRLHGLPAHRVHLHELGGVDTIVDIVGVAAALHCLGVERVFSAPVGVGTGRVRCAHGVLPAPAPATAALLESATVVGIEAAGETVTPTGATLLLAMGASYEPVPVMRLGPTGYGAGTADFGTGPNVLQATLGHPVDGSRESRMFVLEATVDDVTGEVLGHLIGQCLETGAADAWVTTGVGKKSRPVHTVHVLGAAGSVPALETLVLRETGSLGLRRYAVDRTELPRNVRTVTVGGHAVRLKSGPWRTKPEYEDIAAAAAAMNRPLREVAAAALAASADDPGS